MARYELYRSNDGGAYLLDVQSDLLGHLNTRVVVPLMRRMTRPCRGRRLNPSFAIGDRNYVMVTQFISALTVAELPEAEGNLSKHHDQIVEALDMLFQGF